MTFSATQVRTLAHILREAAQAEILPRFRDLGAQSIRQKTSRIDLVTDADEAAEEFIAKHLRSAFPNAVIIGEEATSRNPALLDQLGDASLAIVVDPIDGTMNFAAGLPLFGVMAAVIQQGTAVAGVIYDPMVDDWAIGLRGEGAWLERVNGKQIDMRVSPARPLSEMVGIVSWLFMPEPLRSTVTANLSRLAAAADYRTAAHEYRLLANGHYDFVMFSKLTPWDHVAGCLIHREAGGYSARFNGEDYRPTDTSGGLLCAPDKESWIMLRDALIETP